MACSVRAAFVVGRAAVVVAAGKKLSAPLTTTSTSACAGASAGPVQLVPGGRLLIG